MGDDWKTTTTTTKDGMIQIGRAWVRASRVEWVNQYDTVRFQVGTFSGKTFLSGVTPEGPLGLERAMDDWVRKLVEASR